MQALNIPESTVPTCGVITVVNWTMAPDGETYLYLWADRWVVLTDAQIALSLPKFKSVEHWTLAAIKDDEVLMLIPGCQVKSWSYCKQTPSVRNCYVVGS